MEKSQSEPRCAVEEGHAAAGKDAGAAVAARQAAKGPLGFLGQRSLW